jgi:hypothetical protein
MFVRKAAVARRKRKRTADLLATKKWLAKRAKQAKRHKSADKAHHNSEFALVSCEGWYLPRAESDRLRKNPEPLIRDPWFSRADFTEEEDIERMWNNPWIKKRFRTWNVPRL